MEHDLYCRDSKCGLVGVLSDDEIDYPIDNPCTLESLERGVMRYRHPYDPTKFLQVCIYIYIYIGVWVLFGSDLIDVIIYVRECVRGEDGERGLYCIPQNVGCVG